MRSRSANIASPDSEPDPEDDRAGHRPFGRSLPMLLMRARESVMHHFRPHLRAHELTEQQWRILRVLAEADAGVEMLELAVLCAIQPPSLSRIVPRLAERDLVRRFAHKTDQRRIVVSLTRSGRRLFEAMMAESAEIYAAIEREYGRRRMDALYGLLDGLVAIGAEAGQSPDSPDE